MCLSIITLTPIYPTGNGGSEVLIESKNRQELLAAMQAII